MTTLKDEEIKDYLQEVTIPWFKVFMDRNFEGALFDTNGKVLITTRTTALSFGESSYQALTGLDYDSNDEKMLTRIFPDFAPEILDEVKICCDLIRKIQQFVVMEGRPTSLIDLIPYKNDYASYITTYFPIFHPGGQVIALQSVAIPCKFFSFQDYIRKIDIFEPDHYHNLSKLQIPKSLTLREQEILFLLANGITQDHIAQILHISRSTVGNLISNQLCPKFNIAGSNSKLLYKVAVKNNFHNIMPRSLWKPSVIILDPDLQQKILEQ